MSKKCLSFFLALVMVLSLATPAFAAKVDVSDMPNHAILAALPETLDRPARPTTLEQADVNHGNFGTKWKGGEGVLGEMTELTDSLTAGKRTDTEKMKAIYDWVTQNIEYDPVASSLWSTPANELTEEERGLIGEAAETFYVYTNRRGVCEGYANLCWLMGTIAGIPVAEIHGYAYNGPHAWNAALVDGKWVFFDATWSEWDMGPDYHVRSGGFECYDGLYQLEGWTWDGEAEITVILRPGFEPPANVTIPSYATEIGFHAFSGRTDLESVTIPNSVTTIRGMAFQDCPNLKSVNIPDGVTEIENYMFSGCTGLESVNIPKGVTRIWAYAFEECTSLKSVDIPDSVTDIGQCAFINCTGLESVTAGTGITKEAADRELVFMGCTNLKNMTFANSGVEMGESWEFTIEDGVLTKYNGYGGAVTIPEGVTEIGVSAFVCCENLTSVTFPKSLKRIGDCAFSDCTGLTSLHIPANVTSIGDSAFSYCSGLKSVTIPATVTEMGFSMFYSCTGLESITISDGVTKLTSAFGNCTSLTSVTVPGSVKTLGGAFYDCANLTDVTLEEGITTLAGTFSDCTSLKNIVIPNGVTEISNVTFSGCTSLERVTIPASVTKINRVAFDKCPSLTDIYYGGTEDQWKAIKISNDCNDALFSATIHYNSAGSQTQAPVQPEQSVAYASTQSVLVDGRSVEFYAYALKDANGNDTNYVKLRDVAQLLNGSAAQFEVGWDGSISITTQSAYTPNGSEMVKNFTGNQSYTANTAPVKVNGAAAALEAITLTDAKGGGFTYFKLRDLGRSLGFNVGYANGVGIFIQTDTPYTDED